MYAVYAKSKRKKKAKFVMLPYSARKSKREAVAAAKDLRSAVPENYYRLREVS